MKKDKINFFQTDKIKKGYNQYNNKSVYKKT